MYILELKCFATLTHVAVTVLRFYVYLGQTFVTPKCNFTYNNQHITTIGTVVRQPLSFWMYITLHCGE